MNLKTNSTRQHLTPEKLVLWSSVTIILIIYRKFLLSSDPAGWDTLPQIHLFYKMVRLLKQGTCFGYDLEWFGGFPIFIFYGFLPYLFVALIHILTFGLLPVLFLSKLMIIGTPIFFLITVYF